MVVTGRDSGTEVVLRTHDQPLFRAAKGDAANLSESELRPPVKATYADGIARKIAAQLRERSIIEDLSETHAVTRTGSLRSRYPRAGSRRLYGRVKERQWGMIH